MQKNDQQEFMKEIFYAAINNNDLLGVESMINSVGIPIGIIKEAYKKIKVDLKNQASTEQNTEKRELANLLKSKLSLKSRIGVMHNVTQEQKRITTSKITENEDNESNIEDSELVRISSQITEIENDLEKKLTSLIDSVEKSIIEDAENVISEEYQNFVGYKMDLWQEEKDTLLKDATNDKERELLEQEMNIKNQIRSNVTRGLFSAMYYEKKMDDMDINEEDQEIYKKYTSMNPNNIFEDPDNKFNEHIEKLMEDIYKMNDLNQKDELAAEVIGKINADIEGMKEDYNDTALSQNRDLQQTKAALYQIKASKNIDVKASNKLENIELRLDRLDFASSKEKNINNLENINKRISNLELACEKEPSIIALANSKIIKPKWKIKINFKKIFQKMKDNIKLIKQSLKDIKTLGVGKSYDIASAEVDKYGVFKGGILSAMKKLRITSIEKELSYSDEQKLDSNKNKGNVNDIIENTTPKEVQENSKKNLPKNKKF